MRVLGLQFRGLNTEMPLFLTAPYQTCTMGTQKMGIHTPPWPYPTLSAKAPISGLRGFSGLGFMILGCSRVLG